MTIIQIDQTQSDLVVGLFDKYRVFYKKETDLKLAKKYIQERLDLRDSVIFVALDANSQPIGFTQLYPSYSSLRAVRNWILNDLYVNANCRKQGVGEKLIRKAMEFGKENGAKSLALSTAVDNRIAQKLYEQIGFIRQAPESDFYTYQIGLD